MRLQKAETYCLVDSFIAIEHNRLCFKINFKNLTAIYAPLQLVDERWYTS